MKPLYNIMQINLHKNQEPKKSCFLWGGRNTTRFNLVVSCNLFSCLFSLIILARINNNLPTFFYPSYFKLCKPICDVIYYTSDNICSCFVYMFCNELGPFFVIMYLQSQPPQYHLPVL